jgi:PAS domain S-box-containing protein
LGGAIGSSLARVAQKMHSDRPIRVLIIDDNGLDRCLYKQCLQDFAASEFEFAEADCATTGIEMARTWRPDCTLLDFNLPDLDGIEALTRLRGEPDRAAGATVMLTAYGGEELAVRAMKAGASDYLPKGQLSANTLPHTVMNAIERFQLQQQIAQQQSALAIGERRYQMLLEAIPQMVWSASAEGRLEYANRRWFEYTGLAVEDAALLGWDRLLHPDDGQRTWSAWKRATESGTTFEIQHRLKRSSDGSYRWHLVRAVPLRTSNGELTSWLGTCTEIEEQKRAESATFEEQKLREIGRLAAGIAHDFNNLLVCILGGASCAIESIPSSHPAQEMLQQVLAAGERVAELTRNMLAYAGKASFRVEPINVDQLLHDACESLRASIPERIGLEIRSAPELPPVKTDAAHMRRAIVDLVLNAVEAIGERTPGTISIRTTVVDIDEEAIRTCGFGSAADTGKYVALEVRDTGCGMDDETRNKIFDPFFTTKFIGRGLGLAAVRGFVRSTGGGVQVQSTLGEGTRFQVLLPVAGGERVSHGVCV